MPRQPARYAAPEPKSALSRPLTSMYDGSTARCALQQLTIRKLKSFERTCRASSRAVGQCTCTNTCLGGRMRRGIYDGRRVYRVTSRGADERAAFLPTTTFYRTLHPHKQRLDSLRLCQCRDVITPTTGASGAAVLRPDSFWSWFKSPRLRFFCLLKQSLTDTKNTKCVRTNPRKLRVYTLTEKTKNIDTWRRQVGTQREQPGYPTEQPAPVNPLG